MTARILFCAWRLAIVAMMFVVACRVRWELATVLVSCGALLGAESLVIILATNRRLARAK